MMRPVKLIFLMLSAAGLLMLAACGTNGTAEGEGGSSGYGHVKIGMPF